MSVINLTDENVKEVISDNKIVIIDFYADWCGPCKMFSPTFEEFANDNEDLEGVAIGKLNVDESESSSNDFKIKSLPSVLVIKNGEVVKTIIGAQPKQKLESLLEEFNVENFSSDEDF